jgi:hypothetical protein
VCTYLSQRQNVVSGADPAELENYLASIVRHFGLEWLTQSGINPIQILWNRKDGLATNERFNFGDAIVEFEKSDWASKYFKEYLNEPIGVIILYQAVVVTEKEASSIAHYIVPVLGPRLGAPVDAPQRRLPNMTVVVGVISGQPTKKVLDYGTTRLRSMIVIPFSERIYIGITKKQKES